MTFLDSNADRFFKTKYVGVSDTYLRGAEGFGRRTTAGKK